MQQRNRIEQFPAVAAGLLFLSSGLLKCIIPPVSWLHTFVYIYSNTVFFGIIFCWGIYVSKSILSQKIRRLLLSVVAFMVLYILIGAAKQRIFLDGNYAGRFLWYLYYIPQIFATFLAFIIAFRVAKPEEYKLPKIFNFLLAVGIIIVIGYLTNDIHQLAFRFNLDFVAWDQQYYWGPLFYISTFWIYFFLIAGVALLFVKCTAVNKKKAWLPVFWLVIGSLYIFSDYIYNIWEVAPYNLPETHCFIVIAMLESSIRIGIMPSNSAYGEIVSKSSAAFQIADYKNKVIYRSDNAVPVNSSQMEKAKLEDVLIDADTVLLSNTVTGGNIFWTEDITEINKMNERLEEIGRSLFEEGDLLKAENEITEQRAKIAEQTRLYDSIYELVKPQLDKISRLLEADGDFGKNMAQICILNCYVKRRANLTLLADREGAFSTEELYLSLKESSEYIKLYGAVSDVYTENSETVPSDIILLCFDLWQSVIEAALPGLYAVMGKISFDENRFTFRVSVDTSDAILLSDNLTDKAKNYGGRIKTEQEDGTSFITLETEIGGEVL